MSKHAVLIENDQGITEAVVFASAEVAERNVDQLGQKYTIRGIVRIRDAVAVLDEIRVDENLGRL